MSSKTKTLESILEKYMESSIEAGSSMSYDEYRAKTRADNTPEYAKGIREAYISSKIGSGLGASKEKAYKDGYLNSGYSDYLKNKSKDKLEDDLKLIDEKRGLEEREISSGYLSYLRDYESRQTKLSEEIKESLINKNIADPRAAYTYAISKGLDKDAAKDVSVAVYEVMRNMVISTISERLSDFKLSEDGAVALARGYGLINEDIEYIRELAKQRRGELSDGTADNPAAYYSANLEDYMYELTGVDDVTLDDYLNALEKKADRTSMSK